LGVVEPVKYVWPAGVECFGKGVENFSH
jgi:hypothetical protein